MAPTRKPTKAEDLKSQAQMERDINLDRDMREISLRLQRIEGSIQNIDLREGVQVQMQFQIAALEKRVMELEAAKSSVIKLVMGTVGVAVLALVVGKVLP